MTSLYRNIWHRYIDLYSIPLHAYYDIPEHAYMAILYRPIWHPGCHVGLYRDDPYTGLHGISIQACIWHPCTGLLGISIQACMASLYRHIRHLFRGLYDNFVWAYMTYA